MKDKIEDLHRILKSTSPAPSHAVMAFDVFEQIAGAEKAAECIEVWGGKPILVRVSDGVIYPEWEAP